MPQVRVRRLDDGMTDRDIPGHSAGDVDLPMIPCSGVFRVINIREETIELAAEKLQGECGAADFDSLELLPDGTLQYVSKGYGWETRGILQRAVED